MKARVANLPLLGDVTAQNTQDEFHRLLLESYARYFHDHPDRQHQVFYDFFGSKIVSTVLFEFVFEFRPIEYSRLEAQLQEAIIDKGDWLLLKILERKGLTLRAVVEDFVQSYKDLEKSFSGVPILSVVREIRESEERVVGHFTASEQRIVEQVTARVTEEVRRQSPGHVPGRPAEIPHTALDLDQAPSPSLALGLGPQVQTFSVSAALLEAQWEQLGRSESAEKSRRVDEIRDMWRMGRRDEAISKLMEIRQDHLKWTILSPDVKAKFLRLEASLDLELSGDTARAEQLGDEAHGLAPAPGDVRLRALIALRKTGAQDAAHILAGMEDIDSLNLRAALLLQLGKVDECDLALDVESRGLQPNAETFRIRSLAKLVRRELGEARLSAERAAEREPYWENVRFTVAAIDYFSSLSPAAVPEFLVPWPWPVEWTMVRLDEESVQRRRDAAGVFRELAELAGHRTEDRQRLEAWRLACLVNDPENQEAAVEYCRELIDGDPTHHQAIAWATFRNFDIDLKPSEEALRRLVDQGAADVPHILALGGH